MFEKAGQILKGIREKIGNSASVGKRAMAVILALALVTATVPAIGVTAEAATINASDNKGFRVTAYDKSARIEIPYVSGAANYKVYLSQTSGLTNFSGASCVFNSGYESYAYAVDGNKDAVNTANTISINYTDGGNNTYYFYFVTNDGTNSTVQSSVEVATRLKDSCYWTSPGVYDSGWYAGHESDTNYTISTAAQLAGLAVLNNGLNGVTAVDFSGKTVKLTASVDLSAYLWTPIGTFIEKADPDADPEPIPFSGIFDGGNHVVSGLHTNEGTKDFQGLFGLADSDSVIKNIGVVNGSVIGNGSVGGVAGYTKGAITNCYNTGSVSGTGDNVGGVAGYIKRTITNCYNTGSVSGAGKDVGGVTGCSSAITTNCYNTGSVSGAGGNVGGVAGENDRGTIQSSYNTGTVSGAGDNLGGVAGFSSGTTTNCYNTGSVSGTGDDVGGVAGGNYGTVTNSYNTGTVSGSREVGGVTGFVEGDSHTAIVASCYNTGTVSSTGTSYVGGVVGGENNSYTVTNSYSAGKINGSEKDIYYGTDQNVGNTISDNNTLLRDINGDNAFCAAPTKYVNTRYNSMGGVFSDTNKVNKGYPVLKAFGYTGDDSSIDEEISKDTDGTYLIKNAYQMDLVRNYLGNPNSAKVFKLANNIDLSPVQYSKTQDADGSWQPIGSYNTEFCATFDGNGYSISGIYIYTSEESQGLFGYTGSGSTIQNVGVTGCNIVSGGGYVGGVAGSASTIINCYNTGSVSGSGIGVGGVAGCVTTITTCYNTGIVSDTSQNVGGVAGSVYTITNCSNTGIVSGTSDVGGVAGSATTITTCYNTGIVSGTNQDVGGVVGYISNNGTVTNCYNTGSVIDAVSDNSYVGGVVGWAQVTVTNCYNTGAVSGISGVGGVIGLVIDGATATNCYNTGAVSGIGENSRDVSGVVGCAHTITNCYNTGSVSGAYHIGGVAGEATTITTCYNTGAVSGTYYVGGVAGEATTITTCYNVGLVSGTLNVGGIIGSVNIFGGTYSHNYYSGCSCGAGHFSSTAASDVANETTPFVSCVNPDVGKTETIKELAVNELNSDFKAAFGITAIQYPDGYQSSEPNILTVSGKTVTRVAAGNATVTGKAGTNSNANIIITQNALNMTDTTLGFSGAGTTTASGSAVVTFAAQQTGTNKQLLGISTPSNITGVATGAAKTADGLHLPATVTLVTDNGNVSAGVTWDVNSCAYDPSKTTAQTFTVSGTVILPAGVTNPNSVPLTVSIQVIVGASSGGDTGKTVSGFAALRDAVKNRTAAIGTAISSWNLPQKLQVFGNGINGLWVKVSEWVCSVFHPSVPGTYTFTPVLDNTYVDSGYVDSGYTIADGVDLPKITVTVRSGSSNSSSSSSETKKTTPAAPASTTIVDASTHTVTVKTQADSVTENGNTAEITATVPAIAADTTGANAALDPGKKASVVIDLPKDTVVQQLSAKKDVDLTVTVPHDVAKDAKANAAVDIKVDANILAAAKASQSDITIKIKDADTQQLAYSWTFKGEDLAKSTVPVTDVNISMAVRLTTEVPQVNKVTPDNTGLVLMFDHSGTLPSTASVTFSAKEKGFKPGQKLFFYYYNPTTGQIDTQNQEYTIDADGNVTVQISHCSNYVLLPNKARTITLDTRSYTMPVGNSYITGVKLSGVSNAKLKVYSSTRGVADVTVLKNGNVMATGKKTGITYVMIDVYDSKNNFLTHASVWLTVKKIVKPSGNSAKQYGIF